MQLFYFHPLITGIIAFGLWFFLQTISAYICLKLNNKFYNHNHFIFRTRKWEQNGKIYDHLFHVRKWKQYLPDGSRVVKGGFQKRHLTDFSQENLNQFVIESARAELTHWLAIFPFWLFGFFMPAYAIAIMFVYALIVNAPCIIAQRYNRPRILHYLENKYKQKVA